MAIGKRDRREIEGDVRKSVVESTTVTARAAIPWPSSLPNRSNR